MERAANPLGGMSPQAGGGVARVPWGSFARPPPHITWGTAGGPAPPAAARTHLNFQKSTFLYGVLKKSTHGHTTVGLSCTHARDGLVAGEHEAIRPAACVPPRRVIVGYTGEVVCPALVVAGEQESSGESSSRGFTLRGVPLLR